MLSFIAMIERVIDCPFPQLGVTRLLIESPAIEYSVRLQIVIGW